MTDPGESTIFLESGEDTPDKIFLLVSNEGDERILDEWLDDKDEYTRATGEVRNADFDCCIIDGENLIAHGDALHERQEDSEIPLPILLLIPGERASEVHKELREYPEERELLDGFLRTPVTHLELNQRLEMLLGLRNQAKQLEQQRAQIRNIRDEHAGHGVMITDPDGTIEYVNSAFETQSGYTSEEVIGKNPRILKSGEHDEEFYEELWDTITSGEAYSSIFINERKDGEEYIIDQTIAPILDYDGNIVQYVGINHEITELKQLERKLRERNQQLELLHRILRHDIRNDMQVILAWADALKSAVDEEGEANLDRILNAAEHVVELTDVARELIEEIETGEQIDLEAVSFGEMLTEEVEKRREMLDQAVIRMPEDPPDVTVEANEMLPSVFRNLINNAVQHNDSDTPEVTITSERTNGSVETRVADNGPGIPDAKKDQIFGEKAKGQESPGTGMGLYLVERLVDIYDGEIQIEDNTPRGSIFVITLPIADG